MSETVIFLLSAIAFLLLILVVLASGIRAALLRLERRMGQTSAAASSSATTAPEEDAADAESGQSAFESFLAEDPARATLSKSEQFAAFREWRRKKGMNWSNS